MHRRSRQQIEHSLSACATAGRAAWEDKDCCEGAGKCLPLSLTNLVLVFGLGFFGFGVLVLGFWFWGFGFWLLVFGFGFWFFGFWFLV